MFGLIPFGRRNAMTTVDDDFDRLFDFMNQPLSTLFKDAGFAGNSFKVDVKDNGTSYELKAELPGLTQEDINLTYQNNYLTISTKKEEAHDEKDEHGNYIRRERYSGSMSRSFYIDNIEESRCTAEFQNGILTVTLPKSAATIDTPKQIPIRTIE